MSIAVDARPVVHDEFTHALEAERGVWLRRRFMWLCAVMILLGASMLAMDGLATMPRLAAGLLLLQNGLSSAIYLAAMVYVWRRSPSRPTLVLLATWVLLVTAAADMVLLRMVLAVYPEYLEPSDGLSVPATWAIASPIVLFMSFTLVCLFIPWTVREAVRPAAALAGVGAAVVLFDTVTGQLGIWGPLALLPLPLALLPGLAWCWWRYSRFQQRFRLRFESMAYRSLAGELASARRILDACLPPQRQAGPVRLAYVYEPMRQIGGDMLFVHPADGGGAHGVSVVLFDVTGHGIPAALTVNRLIGELQRIFGENAAASPGEVLQGMNRYVHLTLSSHGIFTTALCLRIDPAGDRIEWASAGHPPAFVRRADGSIEAIESTTVPLGAFEPSIFDPEMRAVSFGRGDAVMFYTDGATEARDPSGDQFSIDALAGLLRNLPPTPDDWPRMILRRVIEHRAAPAEDDTLVGVVYRSL